MSFANAELCSKAWMISCAESQKPFVTRDRQTGIPIDEFRTCELAHKAIIDYLLSDIYFGCYEENAYEIYNKLTGQVEN